MECGQLLPSMWGGADCTAARSDKHRRHVLDDLRLSATMKILGWCGFEAVVAKRAGMVAMLDVLLEEIEQCIQDRKNVFYIDPDRTVNYLDTVVNATSQREGYLQVFRNEVPTFQSKATYRQPQGA